MTGLTIGIMGLALCALLCGVGSVWDCVQQVTLRREYLPKTPANSAKSSCFPFCPQRRVFTDS